MVESLQGAELTFKPSNIEGFTDNLELPQKYVVKHFDKGDAITILEGKYMGETAIVSGKVKLPGK